MALIVSHLVPSTACPKEEHKVWGLGGVDRGRASRVPIGSLWRSRDPAVVGCCRARATAGLHGIVENAAARSSIEIPVTCYQLVGVRDQAEKDEIVKSVMELKSAEIEDGYTMDAIVSRQELLMDVRDKLLFEPEYAGNAREKIPPKSALRIPWAWLPGALCLLQEVGEVRLVLDVGRSALQHPDAKQYVHDLLLSMALAECALAKIGFEKNKVSHGFEALARAQCLLRSKISLGKMTLLSQIEESLEELAPVCTLELLGMPHTPENAERRRGAIAALRELLRQGLDVETSCQVKDWPCFMSQALKRLMATELVDLLPWDNVAVTRKNKKSLESQNQRVVIDFNCFYMVLIAHFAIGFSSKQSDVISKAKTICECLVASEGIDLKFEEALCSFLLGQCDEAEAVEKLKQLELNSNIASQNLILEKDNKDGPGSSASLETWLKDAVLGVFPDTRDCSPSLANFFGGEKKNVEKRQNRVLQTVPMVNHRPLCTSHMSDRRDIEEPVSYANSSRHLGSAVKQLAPVDLQNPLILGKSTSESNMNGQSSQFRRNLGVDRNRVWESWSVPRDVIERLSFVTLLGCIAFTTFKLSNLDFGRMRTAYRWDSNKPNMDTSSLAWTAVSSLNHNLGPAPISRSSVAGRLKKLLGMVNMKLRSQSDEENLQSSCLAANLSSSIAALCRRPMPIEEAEALVKQWQVIKAEALGPRHRVCCLSEVLDESMLGQWQALADAAKARSCFWRFVLLQFSVLRADILSDKTGEELAEIEALLEEAAELVGESQHKNPNYYSTYKIRYILRRQDDGSWRFCECDIQTPS